MVETPAAYIGPLTAEQAAAAMQAARLNALDLLDTAELLYSHKRFAHAVALSTLAIEEAGKLPLLQLIFLGFGGDRSKVWKAYRLHRAKTAGLNPGMEARIRATFPEIPLADVQEIGKVGPSPAVLEANKQLAIYSDCLRTLDEFVCHLPRNTDWRHQAWERLCEAQALVYGLRDYPPEELEIWLKHGSAVRERGGDIRAMLKGLHQELLDKGYVKEGWWKAILEDIEGAEGA